jgi:hypothetical protein
MHTVYSTTRFLPHHWGELGRGIEIRGAVAGRSMVRRISIHTYIMGKETQSGGRMRRVRRGGWRRER